MVPRLLEPPGRRHAAFALCVLVVLSACSNPGSSSFGSWTPPIAATEEIRALEHEMFARVNRDRAAAGLAALQYDERLADVARAHSLDMRDNDFFAHESPSTGVLEDRMDLAGYLAFEMRENLAIAGDLEAAQRNLLASPGHRANIYAPSVTHLGVGIVRGSTREPRALTVTQVFARPAELETPAEVVRGVIARIDEGRARQGLPPLVLHPMLSDLADDQINELPEHVPQGAVGPVADEVSRVLHRSTGHGLGSIRVIAQLVFASGEIEPPAAALTAAVTHAGVAAARGRDERGRPRVKILLLLGRAQP
jgi:uncharacterized protein YkwD